MVIVASVAISALMPSLVTMAPFTAPAIAPTISAATKPNGAGQCHQPTTTPAQTPASASVEPTERSNEPAIIKSIIPATRMPFCAAFRSTAEML